MAPCQRLASCCCRHEVVEPFRIIKAHAPANKRYKDNQVTNSKYTALTFLPLNLYEQFKRPLNRYFLFIGLLQLIPVITPVNPITTLGPLFVAFLITAIKEGYDDLKRHHQDSQFNHEPQQVYRSSGSVENVPSQDIRVGDVVLVEDSHEFPCDLFLLASADPEGLAYIQTANIDGEIDLKPRSALKEVADLMLGSSRSADGQYYAAPTEAITLFPGELTCEVPNKHIYEFASSLRLHDKTISVCKDQLLLQSCILKNTPWVVGLAVYTGNETKVGMNKKNPPSKWAQVDQKVSNLSKFIFTFQVLIFLGMGAAGIAVKNITLHELYYLAWPESAPIWDMFIIPARFLLLTSVMIPISFKVIVDISKSWISLAIQWDSKMYDDEARIGAVANNTGIAEDLGQIEYILTDKTGTLTENQMHFRACVVEGENYEPSGERSVLENVRLHLTHQPDAALVEFFRLLALCNTVLPMEDPSAAGGFRYQGASPDEEELTSAAAQVGVALSKRDKSTAELTLQPLGGGEPTTECYSLLEVLEFNSDRKRMSVIVQRGAAITLFIKGADDKIIERLRPKQDIAVLKAHLDNYARRGLRTLCTALRDLSPEEFETWRAGYLKAKAVPGSGRQAAVDEACEQIERNLLLVGASAIEDKLQQYVPQTIKRLREAGIAFWMLTGDKYETAQQIALSCNLIQPHEELLSIQGADEAQILENLHQHQDHPVFHDSGFSNVRDAEGLWTSAFFDRARHSAAGEANEANPLAASIQDPGCCFILTGQTLAIILASPLCTSEFMSLAMKVPAVVCCRVTPGQKAEVTRLVKETGRITLAIGDGGNDVAMIQEAHVGVGLSGKEGLQAARAADFSFTKFKFLQPLLLVHGHYSYMRTCYIVQYCYYKSILLSFCQIYFNFYALFSGSTYWNSFMLAAWNGMYTVVTVFAYVLDRDLPRKTLLETPQLYAFTRLGKGMTMWSFAGFVFRGLLQAVLCMWLTFEIYGQRWLHSRDGQPIDSESIFTVTYSALLCIQTVTIIVESHTLTWLNQLAIWGTFIFYWISILIYSSLSFVSYYSVVERHLRDAAFYLTVMLETMLCLTLQFAVQGWMYSFRPNVLQRRHRQSVAKGVEREYFAHCQLNPDEDELMKLS
eukprot:GGOE01014636.1.p1 GENE.GGOE01014636.1~~GGOE01014636.1.p1  ORF type:complete len:1133 (-),score=405.57 GGOE01014636.1:276-3674(-)